MNNASDLTINVKVKKPDLTFYDLGLDFDNVKVFLYTEGLGLVNKAARIAEADFITMTGTGDTLTIELPRTSLLKAKLNDCLYGEVKCITTDVSGPNGYKVLAARADIDTIDNLMKETLNG
jgi:hypothetical protein